MNAQTRSTAPLRTMIHRTAIAVGWWRGLSEGEQATALAAARTALPMEAWLHHVESLPG